MVGRIKPKRTMYLMHGDIGVNLHPNQEWSSLKGKDVFIVKHKLVTMVMREEEVNEYFEQK